MISDLHLGADGAAGPLGHSQLFLEDKVMQQQLSEQVATTIVFHHLPLAVTNLGYKKPTPEGRVIFVERERILIRTRCFEPHQWVDELRYECPGNTTLS